MIYYIRLRHIIYVIYVTFSYISCLAITVDASEAYDPSITDHGPGAPSTGRPISNIPRAQNSSPYTQTNTQSSNVAQGDSAIGKQNQTIIVQPGKIMFLKQ